MSASSLPEWKQMLLERKRRGEEAREQRERQEEQKLASMPAWKRGIIQRRKAKHEGPEGCPAEARPPSDGLSDTDSSVMVNLGTDVSTSPDPGPWLDGDTKPGSQVSLETIVPVNENPFIRVQKRKGRDVEMCSPKIYDGEAGRGRDFEVKVEKFRDLSEGREKREASRERSIPREKDRNQRRQDKEYLKVKKDDEDRDVDSVSPTYSPIGPCLRTIRADNIIIIEQERKSKEERRSRWIEADRSEEEIQSKRGLKMDLKELLAGGGSVTEIRASEVLIIKPPTEDREKAEGKREGRELRPDMSWLKERVKESGKEKERPWGQATVIKEDRKDNSDDSVFVERGGRVSQLLSKFGEHHRKPPSRSKSSENLKPPPHLGENVQEEEEREDRRNDPLKGVPKRSFSFSDRVFSSKENGYEEEGERRTRDRIHSEKAYWSEAASLGRDNAGRIKMGCARLLERDRLARHRHWQSKEKQNRDVIDSEEGFTVACVKNVEGIAFAKRVSIRQEGRSREREARKEQAMGVEKVAKQEVPNFESKIQGSKTTDVNFKIDSAFKDCPSLLCTVQDNANRSTLSQPREEKLGHKVAIEAAKNLDGRSGSLERKSPTSAPALGVQPAPLEIQIPRTVFYVAEDMVDKNKPVEDCEEGREVERVKVQKPLSRIESLKEKIRQQQVDNFKVKEPKVEDDFVVGVLCATSAAAAMAEPETEQEVESQSGKNAVEAEEEVKEAEEVVELQTGVHVSDVTQEVSVLKDSPPELPDSESEAEDGEEVVESGGEVTTECSRRESDGGEEEEKEDNAENDEESLKEEDKEFTEEDLKALTENIESEESLSPSSSDSNSLEAMSRIYNLETVGSRSGLCLRDRAADMPPVHLIKIKHLSSPQTESVGSIQRQLENFKLKEQEAVKPQSYASTNSKAQTSPKGNVSKEEDTTTNRGDISSPQRVNSPDQSIEINSAILRCHSPENALKILDLAPTPVSSPCSPSPAQSPSNSPSPSPTPTALFTVRSAAGGQGKRGNTITVTPKKAHVQGSAPTRTVTPSPNAATTTTTKTTEPAKKKYPTVEEIEVIGGYLNLDKSCLVKSKGTPKKVKVCFSEERLEQLCEYPSETSMWAGSPYPHDLDWTDPDQDLEEEVQMETVSVPKATRSVGTATGRGLRMGACHPLLKKHSV